MTKIKVDDEFILDIKRIGINGEGIGFYNNLVIFVDNAIPGEGHLVKVTKVLDKMAYAKSLELKHYNEFRKEPECEYYDKCGGCSTMHIINSKMEELKRDLIIESLSKYTKINYRKFEIKPTISLNEFEYRNRSQLQLVKNRDGSSVAMLMRDSNITISIDKCLIHNEVINRLNKEICKTIDKLNVSIYSYTEKNGILRYLTIRTNKKGEALICLVCYKFDDIIYTLSNEISKLDGVIGVYSSINNKFDSGQEIIGHDLKLLNGKEYIIEKLGNIKYRIYPNTFFQLNTDVANKMLEVILKASKLSFKETVLDAYCGVGAIGLYLAHNAKEVIGVEYNKDSVLAANENAKFNKINNAKFIQGDSKDLLLKLINDGVNIDVLVVDPPRTGLDDKFIDAILKTNIKRIIYVSCNPSTLAKNLERLKDSYNINSIVPFDMFPNTALVESVTVLSLK